MDNDQFTINYHEFMVVDGNHGNAFPERRHAAAGLSLSVASQEKLRQVEAEMLADRDLARQCIVSNAG